ncbi:MAG TPA: hypothetical protein VFG14_16635, partial [Chthoniobacteraceae bacterium]|nr:hypothetical protein [Chthoniobacteraceae bacterium]
TEAVKQLLAIGDAKTDELIQYLPGERARSLAITKNAEDRASQNVRDAAEWANSQKDMFAKRSAVQSVASHWAFNRPEEACEYAVGKGGLWRDEIFDALRSGIGKSTPFFDGSGQWASKLSPELKEQVRNEIAKMPEEDSLRKLLPFLAN